MDERIERAIEWQKAFKKTYNGIPAEVNEMCDLAIEALERQIQKRPIPKTEPNGWDNTHTCPTCGSYLWAWHSDCDIEKLAHCPECGQAILWEEGDSNG